MKKLIKKVFPRIDSLRVEWMQTKERERLKRLSQEDQEKVLCDIYKTCIGRTLDLKNPKSYTEKIQWSKFYDRNPLKSDFADKYKAKKMVGNIIGEEYIIPLLGVWDKFDDIDFGLLPNEFMLKTNHYSGTNVIINQETGFDKRELRKKFNKWMKMNCAYNSFELHYASISPKIFAEPLIKTDSGVLNEFQFFCFDGEVAYFWRLDNKNHTKNIYDPDGNLLSWNTGSMLPKDEKYVLPDYIDSIMDIAKKLSKDFQQVRVDLYDADGKIYFGEMTFTSGSGLVPYIPDDIDYWLGNKWILKEIK